MGKSRCGLRERRHELAMSNWIARLEVDRLETSISQRNVCVGACRISVPTLQEDTGMSLPIKPEVCIIDGRLAVFLGADYKLMPFEAAEVFVRDLQLALEAMRRQQRQDAHTATQMAHARGRV